MASSLPRRSGRAFCSNANRTLNLTEIASPTFNADDSDKSLFAIERVWNFSVDDTESGRLQEITGFGASWTDASVFVFDKLSQRDQQQMMEDVFGTAGGGIGLSLMRHTIGQSDLTPGDAYSYDDAGPDEALASFNLTEAGDRMTVWLKRMLNVSPHVTLFGSPWSAPQWMKQNNQLQTKYISAWVNYLVRYLLMFQERGISVQALTLQNEPLHGDATEAWLQYLYPWTMHMDKTYAALLTSKLGQALRQKGIRTTIWAYDHNTDQVDYPEHVLANAGQYVGGVAWHCYAANNDWSVLSRFHEAYPKVKQYMTECWTHLATSSFFDLAHFVMGPLMNRASGALAWTLGGSTNYDVAFMGSKKARPWLPNPACEACSGLVQVDMAARAYHLTADFYTMGQFSKFVRPGAVFLRSSQEFNTDYASEEILMLAFQNLDGTLAIVARNGNMAEDLPLRVSLKSGGFWTGTLPKGSLTTWVLPQEAVASSHQTIWEEEKELLQVIV